MRLNLLAVSLIALNLSLPVMAADIVIDSGGTTGGTGHAGPPGSIGTAQPSASFVDGALKGSDGEDGGDGDDGGPGDDGTNGTAVGLTTSSITGTIVISTNGGAGGAGGAGGNGGIGTDGASPSTTGIPSVGGAGGDGGNGGKGGKGGQGGGGGAIALTVNHDVTGDVVLSAAGGGGGAGGAGGSGGDGGDGGDAFAAEALATSGDGGDGGDGATRGDRGYPGLALATGPILSGVDGADGIADPAAYDGADGEAGAGGTITVALNAAVGGDLTADAGTGDISVTLNTGASVGGTIVANAAATSALRFAMTVKNKSEYEAAKAYLGDAANALSGSITIDGQTFTWTGFDQLVEALEFIRARAAFSVASGPTYLACSPRAVTAFYKDGGIELIARRTAERGAFRIGTVTGNSFSSQNDAGWTVRFAGTGKGVRFDVLDRAGAVVSTCQG